MKRLICLDTETTGFSTKYDRIVEIGCVDITNGWEKRTSYQCYINPERNVPESAVNVHGLTYDFLCKFNTFDKYIDDFLKFIDNAVLIIHNANFDMNFLNAELARFGKPALENDVIDTLMVAKQQFPGKKVSLDALKNHFNINMQREYHGALLDSEILAQVYLLMQTKQTSLEIKHKEQIAKQTPNELLLEISEEEKKLNESILNDLYHHR